MANGGESTSVEEGNCAEFIRFTAAVLDATRRTLIQAHRQSACRCLTSMVHRSRFDREVGLAQVTDALES